MIYRELLCTFYLFIYFNDYHCGRYVELMMETILRVKLIWLIDCWLLNVKFKKKKPSATLFVKIMEWCTAEVVCTNACWSYRRLLRILSGIGHVYYFLRDPNVLYGVIHFDILKDFWKLSYITFKDFNKQDCLNF